MASEAEGSLEQRRKSLQDELAMQRALVRQRLAPRQQADADGRADRAMTGVSADYPRSVTLRLATKHPALGVGLLALGAALLIRGRRDHLNSILSMAKTIDSLFSI